MTEITDRLKEVLSEVLNSSIDLKLMDDLTPKNLTKLNEENLKEVVLLWENYCDNILELNKEYGVNVIKLSEVILKAIELLIKTIYPNLKVNFLLEWWIYQRKYLHPDRNLKIFDKNKKEIKINTVNQLFNLIKKIEKNPEYDYRIEVMKDLSEDKSYLNFDGDDYD